MTTPRKPTKRDERRAELQASFTLYGWEPMSVIWHGDAARETLLCNAEGAILRRAGQAAIYNSLSKTRIKRVRRQSREWTDLTLPTLELMHARMVKKLSDVATKDVVQAVLATENE